MYVNYKSSNTERSSSGTYGALLVTVLLTKTATNTAIVPADFLPAAISMELFIEGGVKKSLYSGNLLDLGYFATRKAGRLEFVTGQVLTYAAVGVSEVRLFTLKYRFASPVKVSGIDLLCARLTFNQGGQSADISAASVANVKFERTVGNPVAYPVLDVTTVQATEKSKDYPLGDLVQSVCVHNYDKTDYTSQVINSLALDSDKISDSWDYYELLGRDPMNYGDYPMFRYGAAPPTASVTGFSKQSPQSLIIYDGEKTGSQINRAKLTVNWNSAQVTANNNVVVCERLETSQLMMADALERKAKHDAENFNALPALKA